MSALELSVSQLNEYVRRLLQLDPMLGNVTLKGEISNLKLHQTGTVFFRMKDEQAAISCVMLASDAERLTLTPFEGMRAQVTGGVGLYARGGQYQFYAREIRADGVGVLYERLLALRDKLAGEGLFDEARKRPLPLLPRTVGVVSSPTGAVIHDILNVSLRRDPSSRILLCPVRVQGAGSAQEVVRAIRTLEAIEEVDVILVARGGGSLEDLWTFNEEEVVRAVASCGKPVVSAVGHETDVTLCDLAADLRAPTPSAAAECAVPLRRELQERLAGAREALSEAMGARLEREEAALSALGLRLGAQRPAHRVAMEEARLARLRERLCAAMAQRLSGEEARLGGRQKELSLLSPYGVLSRGYAIVLREGRAVESARALREGERVTLRFGDGSARARVEQASGEEGGKGA